MWQLDCEPTCPNMATKEVPPFKPHCEAVSSHCPLLQKEERNPQTIPPVCLTQVRPRKGTLKDAYIPIVENLILAILRLESACLYCQRTSISSGPASSRPISRQSLTKSSASRPLHTNPDTPEVRNITSILRGILSRAF